MFGLQASVYMPTIGKATIMMLLRNLSVCTALGPRLSTCELTLTLFPPPRMRLRSYREVGTQNSSESS